MWFTHTGVRRSTFDKLGEDEQCVVVVFVVVLSAAFVVVEVVDFDRLCCLLECCWFVSRCRADGGRGSHLLGLLLQVAFHRVSFRSVLCRGEPSRDVCHVVVVSGDFGWLYVCVDVVLTSLSRSSVLPTPRLLG